MSDYWKKKMDELEKETKKSPSLSYWDRKMAELEEEKKTTVRTKKEDDDDIAPIKSTKDDDKVSFFQKPDVFDDGGSVMDVVGTILGTVGDAGLNAVKGVAKVGEGIGDLISYGVAGVADKMGEDAFARGVREKANEGLIDNLMKPAEDYLDKYSILGRTADGILQGFGQAGLMAATGGMAAGAGLGAGGVTAVTSGVMGLSGVGSGMGEAYEGGANDLQAFKHGLNSGAADAVSELIFGGLGKSINALGFSRGLSNADDMLAKLATSKFKNQVAKNIVEFGIKSGAEGLEEVLAGVAQAYSKYNTYLKDQGVNFGDVLKDENLLEQFIIGAAVSGGMQSGIVPGTRKGSLIEANAEGRDFITGLNQNEQAVVKKEIENRIAEAEADGTKLSAKEKAAIEAQVEKDLEKGYISTDLIDEVVGGFTYQAYKDSEAREDALQKEFDELGNVKVNDQTVAQQYRYRELSERIQSVKDGDIRKKRKAHLDQYVAEQVKGSRLAESYNEKARVFDDYKPDYSKYEGMKHPEAARKTVESVLQIEVDGKKVNNTNRIHDFVDMVAKASGDTGIAFTIKSGEQIKADFIARQTKEITKLEAVSEPTAEQTEKLDKLKDLLEKVKSGKVTVNGDITADGIVLSIDSKKPLNRLVGHEITHSFEPKNAMKSKDYDNLKQHLFSYAESKGVDIESEIANRKLMYEGVTDADPEAELVADLVGDFLFNDVDYIRQLSVENRNIFQRVYDEIKHLLKMATAGSKEARELERVKRDFEKLYRESGAQKNTAISGAKNSIETLPDGKKYVRADRQVIFGNDPDSWSEQVESYINGKIRNGENISLVAEDGEVLVLTANTAGKIASNKTNHGTTMDDAEFSVKANAGVHIDELAQISVNADPDKGPVKDHGARHGAFAEGGWTYRTAFFHDFDGKYYRLKISAAKGQDGNVVYNIGDIKERSFPKVTGSSAKGGALNGKASSGANVAQNAPEVKGEYSLSDTARFSLSEAVEETKDLVALHNLTADKLTKSLELGGLPMPSLAITKADIPHSNFGEITLIFGRETIDPKANKKNKAYSADAWTPVFPRVEYEADSKVGNRISQKLSELETKIDDHFQRDLRRLQYGFNDYLNSQGGEEGLIQYAMDNYGLKAAYLEEQGKHIEKVTKQEEAEKGFNPDAADKYLAIMDILGVSTAEELGNVNLKDARDNHGAELEAVYPGITKTAMRMGRLFNVVRSYLESKDSSPVYNTVTDSNATRKAVDDALDLEGFEAWTRNLFSGIVKDSGIYNNKELYTPSGNRRTFKQTHLPVTLENIVKAMASQNNGNAKNVSGFNGIKTLRAATAETFKSVEDMHKRKGRLQNRTQEEADAINDALQERLFKIIHAIDEESGQKWERNPYIRFDTICETIAEIGEGGKYNVSDIQKAFSQYGREISDDTALEVKQLLYDVTQMPVNIFESKPQRVVSFDEAKVFVIPYDADIKLKQELLNRGYSIAEYDPKVEGDRQRVVNQFEEYKFSLSDAGTAFTPVGRNEIYGKDLLRQDAPAQEEIAPTVSETESVAPVVTSETETTTEESSAAEMFPDDLAPVESELDKLYQQKEALESRIVEAVNSEDMDAFTQANTEYDSVMSRIEELENELSETENARVGSLDDADAPPEMEAPYPGEASEPMEPADPFADRDMFEVGKRSVKAYQYENPEVKPFFTEAALGMLDDLHRGTKGEKIFNGDVYYQSGGEKGWDGTKRSTTADIAALLDEWHYTYAEIEEGLNAIIEDDGKENNAVSKRIEFMLDDRLRNGYTDVWGERMPANQEYINLLNEKQITEYSKEAFDRFMATADQYAPPEDIAPVKQKPVRSEQMKLPLYHDPNNVSPAMGEVQADGDIAPLFETESGQQSILEPVTSENAASTRKALHARIMDNIKARFAERGFDFDEVLKEAKNLSTFATVDNIPQRVMEKALGYKEGGILSDITVNQVAQNETKGIKWLNAFTDRKKGLLAQISKQYNIKPGSKESAAAQMYAEGFYVNEQNEIISYGDKELAADFPDATRQAKIKALARDPRIRKIYDDTLKAINESRTRNAYPEIPRLDNYFLHFRAMNDTFSKLGLPFNPNDIRAKDLPTDLNGVTADLKPGQPFFASAMHREGKRTSFDLLGGLEQYLSSAKNQIYHIDDIQNLRALRNYIADTYGQAHGLENLDELSQEAQFEQIKKVYNSHLSTFAKFLHEEANILAGKTALADRAFEGWFGRKGLAFLDTVNRQVGANMVGYNVSSSLTNFLAPVQAFAKTNKAAFIKGMAQFASNKVQSIFGKGDGFAEQSPVMIRRKGAERFHRTPWQKMSDPGYALMGAVDSVSTELIARAKYNDFVSKGMDSQKAHIETDKWVSRLMGDRSLGQQPQLYNSKVANLFLKFQLEVRNQLDSQFYDTIQETKASNEDIENGLLRNAKTAAKVTSTFVQLAVAQHLFGKAFESIAGYNPAFDIISAIIKTFGWDDDEESEDTALDNIEQGFLELLEDMPYASTFTGGRIPISSALPVAEVIKGKDQYGNEKSRWKTLGEAAHYYLMPGGYGQLKKTKAGLKMFSEEHPIAGSYTDSGNLRFPVEDTLANRAQAAVFGQYASGNARDYFDNDYAPLKENQIQEYADSGMSIQDYRKYRDGLKDFDKQADKANYINSLDLTEQQKIVLKYYLYDEEGYKEENPEKYAFLENEGIGYIGYKELDEDTQSAWSWAFNHQDEYQFYKENGVMPGDYTTYYIPMLDFGNEDNEAYQWAFDNPEKATFGKVFSEGVTEYRRYASDLYNIKADKDENGKSISGSRKEKVLDYINSLDIDYGAKLILFKNEYNSDDESNYEIIDYLNSRSDISFEEEVAILRELGFTVTEDGTIYWD